MKRFPKSTMIALALGALIGLLIAAACGGGADDGAVIVSLSPSNVDSEAGGSFTVDVEIDPKGHGISAAEVTINFDPQILAYEGMSAGDLLGPSPILGFESAESGTGQVVFALARRGPTSVPTDAGTLATLTFTVLEDAPAGEYGVTIYRVGLADEAHGDVPLIASSSATVNL